MIIGDSFLVPINNNHNILSTSSSCNSSSTTTTTTNNAISDNTIDTTTTTSSSPTSPPAAMVQQQQQQALKCPRCDSSHTKFCYYNNYSLSQPRHFCKACKRYWTRGGTLRSVPVGGGCRKNKRVKKATPTSSTTAAASSSTSNIPHNSSLVASPLPATTTATDHLNSLFYGLLPSAAVASGFPTLRLPQMYDQLQPQMSALGIGFSSGRRHDEEGSQLGFGASSFAGLQQTGSSFLNNYQPSLNILEAGTGSFELPKQVKVEEGENCNVVRSNNSDGIEWQDQAAPDMNAGEEDSSYLYWSSAIFGGAGWPDIANSSISPMI